MKTIVISTDKLMGKNILTTECEYYGDEMFFKVFNRKESWCIQFSRVTSSTNRLFEKGTSISLYENILSNYKNWESFLSDGSNYNEEYITQQEFLILLENALN